MGDRVRPEDYDFKAERQHLIGMIAFEYGMLCQATGQYNDNLDILRKIAKAANAYGFVIDNQDSDEWTINLGKARDFAAQKAREIHDAIFKEKEDE